jgi:nitroreductase
MRQLRCAAFVQGQPSRAYKLPLFKTLVRRAILAAAGRGQDVEGNKGARTTSTNSPTTHCSGANIMVTRRQASTGLLSSAVLAASPGRAAENATAMDLPSPRADGGKPLIQALRLRRSTREYAPRPLPKQVLSDLLWSAFGINRPASGDRTAPYWRHVMVIDVYAAMADGVWLYEPKRHALLPHLRTDIRAQTGLQDFVGTAPLNLVYVAHGERMQDISAEERRLYASVDAGFIGQNVYLFCASEGLATVFRGAVDYDKLGHTMQLGEGQFVTFAQTVGYSRASE